MQAATETNTFSSLFNDGVHQVLAFLDTKEWNIMLRTAKWYYTLAQTSEPCRHISLRPVVLPSEAESNGRQLAQGQSEVLAASSSRMNCLMASSLRRHVTSLVHVENNAAKKVLHRMPVRTICDAMKHLPHLTAMEVRLQDDDVMSQPNISLTKDGIKNTIPSVKKGEKDEEVSVSRLGRLVLVEQNNTVSNQESASMRHLLTSLPGAAPHLTDFTLSSFSLIEIDLEPLCALTQLRQLHLSHSYNGESTNPLANVQPSQEQPVVDKVLKQLILLSSVSFHLTSLSYEILPFLQQKVFANPKWTQLGLHFPTIHGMGSLVFGSDGINQMQLLHKQMPNLTSLDFYALQNAGLREISLFVQCRSLSFNMINNLGLNLQPIPIVLTEVLTQNAVTSRLEHLQLPRTCLLSKDQLTSILNSNPRLTSLVVPLSIWQNIASFNENGSTPLDLLLSLDASVAQRIEQLELQHYGIDQTQLVQVTQHFSRLRRFSMMQVSWTDFTFAELRSFFNKAKVFPDLEYLSLQYEETNVADEPTAQDHFVWEKKRHGKKDQDGNPFRVPEPEPAAAVVPPAAPLVGIELNPGPPLNLNSLFTDGIHLIFGFLTGREWKTMICTAKRYYSIAQMSEPCRRMSVLWLDEVNYPSVYSSSLRHHISSFDLRDCSCDTSQPLIECLSSLPSLTSLDVTWERLALALEEAEVRTSTSDPLCPSPPVLPLVPRLTRLHIYSISASAKHDLPHLTSFLPYFSSLTDLSISLFSVHICESIFTVARELSHLKKFDVRDHWRPPRLELDACAANLSKQLIMLTERFQHLDSISYLVDSLTLDRVRSLPVWPQIYLPQVVEFPIRYLGPAASLTSLHRALPGLTAIGAEMFHESELPSLGLFTQMRSLSIGRILTGAHELIDTTITSLTQHCRSLRELHLTRTTIVEPSHWSSLFTALPDLTKLTLVGNCPTPSQLQIDLLASLTSAFVHEPTTATSSTTATPSPIPVFSRLNHLTLNNAALWESTFLQFLMQANQLRQLTLNHVNWNGTKNERESIDIIKRHLASAKVLPQLEYLYISEISPVVPSFGWGRFYRNNPDPGFRSPVVDPPRPRLVGIELNPGPKMMSTSAQTLFTDGLLLIISYLTFPELSAQALLSACHHWHTASSRSRSRSESLVLAGDRALLLFASPLRLRVTSLVIADSVPGKASPNSHHKEKRLASQTQNDFFMTLLEPLVPSLTTYETRFRCENQTSATAPTTLTNEHIN